MVTKTKVVPAENVHKVIIALLVGFLLGVISTGCGSKDDSKGGGFSCVKDCDKDGGGSGGGGGGSGGGGGGNGGNGGNDLLPEFEVNGVSPSSGVPETIVEISGCCFV